MKREGAWLQGGTIAVMLLALAPLLRAQRIVDVPNVQDTTKAKILSLRLYMTSQQAAAAIRERLHDVVPVGKNCGRKGCTFTASARYTPGKRFVQTMTYNTDKLRLQLGFVESYPFDPARPEILTSILYAPATPTTADQEAFLQSAKAKYGPPTTESPAIVRWCSRAIQLNFGAKKELTCSEREVPTLVYEAEVNGAVLKLQDLTVGKDYAERWNREKTGSAPPL